MNTLKKHKNHYKIILKKYILIMRTVWIAPRLREYFESNIEKLYSVSVEILNKIDVTRDYDEEKSIM